MSSVVSRRTFLKGGMAAAILTASGSTARAAITDGKTQIATLVDISKCIGCEACIERCHFNAMSMTNGVCVVDTNQCYGCGLCISSCESEALTLIKKVPEEISPPPVNDDAWREIRAKNRE